MLLDTATALKVAHDIIHDSEEFFAKWKLLGASSSEMPEGFVDFEFSDGSLIRIPCVWQILALAEGAERPGLVLRNGDTTVTWKPGEASSAAGAVAGLLCDGTVSVGSIAADALSGLNQGSSGDPLRIMQGLFNTLVSTSLVTSACTIKKITTDNTAEIIGSSFEDLFASGEGYIDADIDEWGGDTVDTDELVSYGEWNVPVEKMNAWKPGDSSSPSTDAIYTGAIPFLPLDQNGLPVNNFDAALTDNPFFPDWVYTSDKSATWRPAAAWVPSLTKPSTPYWRDADGIFWYLARVTTGASMFGGVGMVYPPRCKDNDNAEEAVPPVPAVADGIVVTVQHLTEGSIPYAMSDRYEYRSPGEWDWEPGRIIQVNGQGAAQFVLKRVFTIMNGMITAVEYQLLPLGDVNGRS